jgi:hypothetical protein
VTGIPLHIFGSQRAQHQISDVFRKALKAPAVAVLPQGFGALCLAISTNSALAQGRVALVDIGSRTTELICFSDGQYLNHESAGVVLGVGQVYTQVAQKLSSTFKAFADYWGFEPRVCRPYRAQTKGKVESGVKYVKRNFLPGRTFVDLVDFQAQLDEWTATIADCRVHGTHA